MNVHHNRPMPGQVHGMKKKKHGKLKQFLIRYGIMSSALFLIFIVAVFAWYSRGLPNPDKIIDRQVAQSTRIYDSTGETTLYEIHGEEKRTIVRLDDIPDTVKWATISAEDKNFYTHHGFNLLAMFKGVVIDPILTGNRPRGGSTLTQQLVKNAILTDERSVSRKIREFILSFRIEQKFEKDEILQMYLNEIPYGSTAYGVQSSAQTYFGKDVEDLTLAESALLASLPKAPTYYSPYGSHVDDLINRQQYVLSLMAENGYITEKEADEAKKQELEFKKRQESITAPHFVIYVKEQLAEMFGEKVVEQSGLKVTTTLDIEKQEAAEEAVLAGVNQRGSQYGFSNAALLSINPKNGHILAMVGSKDYFDDTIDGNVNVTTRLRQPGSSIKPMVYAAAFDKGYTPDTILFDVNTTFKTDTSNYNPKNYDLGENGPVTMRKALQGSLNTPAVKALYLVGVEKEIDFLELMGYSSFEDRSRFGLALVLGGGEVTLMDHVSAFAVFPNEGVYREPVAIQKVEDAKGNILFELKEKDRKVLDDNIAKMMNNVLSDNGARAYAFGANNHLTLSNRPAGAKTGTTDDYRDAWTVGYTPSLVTGVWVGNNDNSKMRRGAAGGVVAAPIWNQYMNAALAGTEVEYFAGYDAPKTDKAILNGNFANEKTVRIDKYSGLIATENTPAEAVEERTFKEIHNILYYVDKDNPQGSIPSNPGADSQYASWESAVQSWVEKQKQSDDPEVVAKFDFINEVVPTEEDNVHLAEYRPELRVLSPSNNQTIIDSMLNVQVSVSASRGIAGVDYYLDDKLIGRETAYPYNLSYPVSSMFENGYHRLRVVAYDDVMNQAEMAMDLNVLIDNRAQASINWVYPVSGAQLVAEQFPLNTRVRINDLMATKKIDFYYRPKGDGSWHLYASEVSPSVSTVSVMMDNPNGSGEYELQAVIILKSGGQSSSDIINVKID